MLAPQEYKGIYTPFKMGQLMCNTTVAPTEIKMEGAAVLGILALWEAQWKELMKTILFVTAHEKRIVADRSDLAKAVIVDRDHREYTAKYFPSRVAAVTMNQKSQQTQSDKEEELDNEEEDEEDDPDYDPKEDEEDEEEENTDGEARESIMEED